MLQRLRLSDFFEEIADYDDDFDEVECPRARARAAWSRAAFLGERRRCTVSRKLRSMALRASASRTVASISAASVRPLARARCFSFL
jgi:hypothetical protein